MKLLLRLTGAAILICGANGGSASGQDGDVHTLESHDANGTVIIRQSGDPAKAEVSIKRTPGQTIITRKSGGNSVTVIQSTNPAIPPEPPR